MSADRESLLLRGVLDLCVLALLDSRPVYGYEIAARLNDRHIPAAAGSIYPLLARLQRSGDVRSDEQPSPHGPPRKWWSLTSRGRATLDSGRVTWVALSASVDALIGSSPSDTNREQVRHDGSR